LVKTTPKPNATKKSSGELGPPPLPLLLCAVLDEAAAADEVVDMVCSDSE
jgi:hypothetical protein